MAFNLRRHEQRTCRVGAIQRNEYGTSDVLALLTTALSSNYNSASMKSQPTYWGDFPKSMTQNQWLLCAYATAMTTSSFEEMHLNQF